MELYILSKQDLSILSICKLADYQINLDEETNAKSTFTLMKTNGLKKGNYMTLNGLYRQFIFVIDDVQTEKGSNVVTVTALDISNVFNRKVIEKNINTMKSKSIEEFLANTISENFVNSDDTVLNVNYIEIYWHTNTQGNVATNAENGLYNFHTFLINCRQYKNIYTDFKLENLGNPQTVEGKTISVEAKNRKIVDIMLEGESQQATRSGKNLFDKDNANIINTYIAGSGNGVLPSDGGAENKCVYIPCKQNTTYTIQKMIGKRFGVAYTYETPAQGVMAYNKTVDNNVASITITTDSSAKYLVVYLRNGNASGEITLQQALDSLQIEKGSTATDYEPYGASPSPDYRSKIENLEGKNKFSGWVKGIAINATDGHQYAYETRASSDYIAVDFNQNPNYHLSGLANTLQTFVAAYNSNKEFLGRTKSTLVSYFSLNSSFFTMGTAQGTGDIAYLRVTTYENTPSGTTGAIDDVDNLETQLEEGTVATPYVPYNSLEVKVEGKNKFDCANSRIIYNNANTSYERLENGLKLISNGRQYNIIYFLVDTVKNLKDKTLTLSSDISFSKDNQLTTLGLFYTDINGGNRTGLVNNANITSEGKYQVTGQVKEGENRDYVCIGLRPNMASNYASGDYTIYDNLQVEIGETATDYEPYKSQVATFPLSEGQKLMEGSYLADDGIHHNFKEGLANGTSTTFEDAKENGKFYCNQKASGNLEGKTIAFDTEVTDAIVQYELAEPEIVPYTAEQQEAWDNIKNLTLFEGVNHISSDANMVLKYYPLEAVGLKFVLRIDIENKQETTKLIDTTLPEVTDYNKVYEEDVTAKVTAYIRENNTEYNLYLKTDRTTTTNKNDPDRASGKIEVISVETADNAPEEALNVMKGNNYKHLVEFKIAKTSKLMDITELHIGRPIRIKTEDDIYDSYISAITLSDENFVYFKSGSLRITLLDKLKQKFLQIT